MLSCTKVKNNTIKSTKPIGAKYLNENHIKRRGFSATIQPKEPAIQWKHIKAVKIRTKI